MTFKVKGGLQVNSTVIVDANGSWTGNTIGIAYGGTGANTAPNARKSLGLEIGANVQAYNPLLSSISDLSSAGPDKIIYFNTANTVADSPISLFGRNFISSLTAEDAKTTLNIGSIASQSNNNVNITGGSITGITDLAINDGGTGASTAFDARINLGLQIGANVQAYDIKLDNLSGLSGGADQVVYFTGANTLSTTLFTSFGRSFVGASTAEDARTALNLGTISSQANNNVNITGGSITNITDLAINDGGTGASTASDARTNLGLAIGTDVQAYNIKLDNFSNLNASPEQIAYFNGANTLVTTTFSAFGRSIVGAADAESVRTTLNLGTISTQANNNVNITGGSITGITDLAIADGGTGASTASDARINLGLQIGANVQAWDEQLDVLATVSADVDKVPYFTSANTASVTTLTSYGRSLIASANTEEARTVLSLGSISTQDSSNVIITGGSITGITDLAIADGGTGASSASGARTNLGLVIGTNVQAYNSSLDAFSAAANGYVVKTSSSTVESRSFANGTGVTITNGDGISGNTTISIGQDVSTTSNVTFYDVTIDGTLNSSDITSANVTVNGNAIVTGNLIVQGTTTTIESSVVNVGDTFLILNSDEVGVPTQEAGVEIERGTALNVSLVWREAIDRWSFTNDGVTYYNIPTPDEYTNNVYDISAVAISPNSAKLRLTGGGIDDDVTFVGAGTVLVSQTDANTITINGIGSTEFEVTAITDGSAEVVNSFAKATYRSAEYTYTATVTTGTSHYVTGKIMIIHDGTSAYNTQYAILSTNPNDDLVDFTADVSGSNVRLLAQATTGNVVKVKINGATYSTV
jgi:hypothetical protein